MATNPAAPPNKLLPFVATICLFLIVAAMYFARVVLVPVVLAALLAFVLTPVVSALQHRKVPRVAAALLTGFVAFAFLGGVLVLVFFQLRGLGAYLRTPKAQEEIHAKAQGVYDMLKRESLGDLAKVFDEAYHTVNPSDNSASDDKTTDEQGASSDKKAAKDVAAVAAPAPPSGTPFWGPFVEWVYAPVLEVFVDAGVVMVLVIFMLSQHEDLRNRVLRLSGKRNVTSATKALSDASRRVRKFLLMQFFINCTFAAVVSGGLLAHWRPLRLALWGVLGGLLRYVPYVGTWLASFCPVLLAVAVLQGWWPPDSDVRAVRGVGHSYYQHRRADYLRPQRRRLRHGPAYRRCVLDVAVGTGRSNPVHAADGLPGCAGAVRDANGIPQRTAGR